MYTRNEKIVPIYIEDEMRDSYVSYAMSVIVGRALPDVRDGLKPVHRRILYAMKELNLEHNKPYKKCARITGETLGKFHPHGDIAVYDALVRMAQDFSLRYPLVDGQGNFGCFTKDTKVRLTDGRSLSFGQLIKETREGKKNYTYTFNHEKGKVEISLIKKPRLTKKKARVVKVILDNGEEIKCTPNHRFMLRDGIYKEAKDLVRGDSLMPFYIRFSTFDDDPNMPGYEMVYQPFNNKWDYTHHLADECNIKNGIYPKSAGRIRHHVDFNKLNNNPENICRSPWEEHWQAHYRLTAKKHKNDPEYVKKLTEGRNKYWNTKGVREKYSQLFKALNKRNWRNPKYRKRMIRAVKKKWEDPEFKRYMAMLSSKRLKKLWERKDFCDLLSKLKSKELKARWQDGKYRFFIAESTRKMSLKLWSDPNHRERISRLNKQRCQDPVYRKELSVRSRELWKDPEFRAKYPPDHFNKMAKKLWEDPLTRELHRQVNIRQWQNEEFRKKISESTRKRNIKRLEENPDLMKKLTQKAKISLRKKWGDPFYKERVIKSKILGFVNNLLERDEEVTPLIYERDRVNNGVPNIKNALSYFSDFQDMVNQAKGRRNHEVKAVKFLAKREDVYDLTIEKTHNFALASGVFVHNSIDGDPPASLRYTEARLDAISEHMLADIEKETVAFMPNFDDTLKEPTVLPAALPNLLINGSSGIAVGMATNIPPHNLSEVVDGVLAVIDDPGIDLKDLMKHVKGPDFPTGGIICGREGIVEAYQTGRGRVIVHAKATTELLKSGRQQIVITEIPYQVNKTNLIESIANLVTSKHLEGIGDLRDESDKDGMRIVIELRREQDAQVVLNQLYKHTQMQTTFGIIMLALVNSRPEILSLKELIQHYIEYRKEIVINRTKFDLAKAEERAHILEGLKICLKNLDKIVNLIKKSKDPKDAKEALMTKFGLSDRQAQAILEMQLQRLTGLEREKIDKEYLELLKKIEYLKAILESGKKVLEIIKNEALEIKKKFGDERRTAIMGRIQELEMEDLIAEEDVVITISHQGYIKRFPVSSYRKQKRGGRGITGAETKEEDFIEDIFIASTHDNMLFFTNKGKGHLLRVYDIPQAGRLSKGKSIVNLLKLSQGEAISSSIAVKEFEEDKNLFMVTKQGKVKKTALADFANVRRGGINAVNVAKDDLLVATQLTGEKDEIFIATSEGKAIRFLEKQIRRMGRAAAGVRGIRLAKKDEVVGMAVVRDKKDTLLTVTKNGYGKRTEASEYRVQSRGGKGIINIKVTSKKGPVVGLKMVSDKDDIMLVTHDGMVVRFAVKDIRTTGRAAQGVRIIKLAPKDSVASVASVVKEE